MNGIGMEYVWDIYGIPMEYLWNAFCLDLSVFFQIPHARNAGFLNICVFFIDFRTVFTASLFSRITPFMQISLKSFKIVINTSKITLPAPRNHDFTKGVHHVLFQNPYKTKQKHVLLLKSTEKINICEYFMENTQYVQTILVAQV